jgi:hypothetical protein
MLDSDGVMVESFEVFDAAILNGCSRLADVSGKRTLPPGLAVCQIEAVTLCSTRNVVDRKVSRIQKGLNLAFGFITLTLSTALREQPDL